MLSEVRNQYGAPMGRPSYGVPEDAESDLIQIIPVPLTGGYDEGGAYWGCGAPLWCASGIEYHHFVRAGSRAEAAKTLGIPPELIDHDVNEDAVLAAVISGFKAAMLWTSDLEDEEKEGACLGLGNFSELASQSIYRLCHLAVNAFPGLWPGVDEQTNIATMSSEELFGRDLWLTIQGSGISFLDAWEESWANRLNRWCDQVTSNECWLGESGEIEWEFRLREVKDSR